MPLYLFMLSGDINFNSIGIDKFNARKDLISFMGLERTR